MSRRPRDMEVGLAVKALDEIARKGLTDTVFFHVMGEATLYPDLEKVIQETKARKLNAVLTTNGWGSSSDLLGRILEAGVDHIIFSAQTPDERSFKLRRASVDFFEYKRSICQSIVKLLEESSAKATLSFLTTPMPFLTLPSEPHRIIRDKATLTSSFGKWFDDIVDLMKNSGLRTGFQAKRSSIMKRLSRFSLFGWNKLLVSNRLSLETRVLGDWIHPGLTADKMTKARFGCCDGLRTHFGILSNGDVVFCCTDFDGNTSLGNINEMSITQALAKKRAQDAIHGFDKLRVVDPYCQKCLGDVSFQRSVARQIGSIVYFKFYRRWWEKKRKKEDSIL